MNRIKELREERNLTQMELAKEVGISQSTLSKWELDKRGNGYLESLKSLAKYFNVSVEYLIGNSDYEGRIEYSETNLTPEELKLLRYYRFMDEAHKSDILDIAKLYTNKD